MNFFPGNLHKSLWIVTGGTRRTPFGFYRCVGRRQGSPRVLLVLVQLGRDCRRRRHSHRTRGRPSPSRLGRHARRRNCHFLQAGIQAELKSFGSGWVQLGKIP